ncbi:MAM and LDL-receptor class A domain-containing protein 1-like [Saccostrea echinata]|uniref:MAM and LDL-receptor class A domain-containing protein 1-like n=1 Tax=Saccostrea echinata TaxID=191078 RepID=UPI002A80B196|nr:MAM and LDL-receptor class A domain-containing protein 1-like [Saccostrea echinata]
MGTNMRVLSLLAILQCLVVHAHRDRNKIVGKAEARQILNELRQRHDSHISKKSAGINFGQEEEDIDQLLLRTLKNEEEENGDSEDNNDDSGKGGNAKGGAKLIEEALKGNVDPDSDVVNLLESMFVDEGNRHNLHPDGIDKIALKKGKVFGDTHDNHRLTQQQLDDLKNNSGGRKRRNFLKSAPLWPDNIIPYTIDSSLSSTQSYVDVINAGIQQFTDYTCLKWVPQGSTEAQKLTHSSYIEFFSESGCWSYVGMVFSGKQQVSLQAPGCVSLSTTVHEMTHAIGQMHEQSRSDRDNHVTMLWANTQGGTGNFNMAKSTTHDYNPYDYESVLQYSLTAFSTNGQPTMEFHDRRLDFLADSATGLMFYDIQDITDAYDCTKPCRGPNNDVPLKQCQNGGFVLHTCDCHCPEGLTGTLCETTVTDPACGGIVNLAEGETQTITTPNFNNGGPYPTGKNCVWLVKGPDGKNVQMTITEMDLTTQNGACSHWLEIQYNLLGQTGPRRCGTVSNEVYVSSDNGDPTTMLLKFDSTFASTVSAGKGFSLAVTTVGLPCKSQPCKHGTCNEVGDSYTCTCDPNYSGQHCDTLTDSGTISCGFEAGEACYFANSPTNSYDWITNMGTTPSSGTGPSAANTGSQYLYAEVSSPVPSGTKFHFETPLLSATERCMSFWYHMNGNSVGTLNVLRNGNQVWTISGSQGDQWNKAEFNIDDSVGYKVTFEAIRANSWQGDIAIDDVLLTPCGQSSTPQPSTEAPTTQQPTTQQPTTQQPTTTQPTTPQPTTPQPTTPQPTTLLPSTKQPTTQQPTTQPVTTSPQSELHCTFEDDTCFLQNIDGDSFDWTIRSGSTPSSNTGPSSAFEGTMYSYIEASGKAVNAEAKLQSSTIATSQIFCLTFAYHMYGANIGSLTVDIISAGGTQTLFSESGNKGNLWNKAYIPVSPTSGIIEFTALRGDGFRGDISIDDIHFQSGDCAIPSTTTPAPITPPFSCTFEPGAFCFLTQSYEDDFDWTSRDGGTPSSNTGPSAAFEGTTYAYTEVSGLQSGNRAVLESSSIITADSMCLSFAYSMYGSNMGDLEVVYDNMTVFAEIGDKGDNWQQTKVTLPPPIASGANIQFVGTRGSGFRGDIAIDDIQVVTGDCVLDCSDNPCGSNSMCIAEPGTAPGFRCECAPDFSGQFCEIALGSVECTFEDGENCFLENVNFDDFEWSINSGETPSSNTGPSSAIQGTNYAYIETSGRSSGDKAILATTLQFESGERCLTFNYNMFGSSIGELRVLQSSLYSIELFSKIGQQSTSGSDWKTAGIDIYHDANDAIMIEASRGSSYTGDIALDNIRYIPGRCGCDSITCMNGGTCMDTATGGVCQCPSIFTGPWCESFADNVLGCSFDDSPCFLENVTGSDETDWSISSGSTPSSNTGPGSSLDGPFAFIEATGLSSGNTAVLTSEQTSISDVGPRCLRFYYNMNGANMGTLRVRAGERGSENEVWSLSGDQGDVWTPVEVDIPAATDLVVNFEGIRGSGYRSDIAIDAVSLSESSCTGN